jgi:prepilin-type N-terminal cleavage/methylation domain-containing protein
MKPLHDNTAGRRGGFSLVEVLVAAALLAVVLSSVALVGGAADKAYRTGTIESHLESKVAIAVDSMVDELRIAGVDTITPDPIPGVGASNIRYVQATGITNGEIDWTPLRTLRLELETGELDDGIDNNANGLIDEGRILLIEDLGGPDERQWVLTRWVAEFLEGEIENGLDDNGNGLVDESGFLVERIGESYVIRLTLQRRTVEGYLLTRTAQTSTKPRNRLGD